MSHHNRTRQPSEDDEEDDPLDRILKKSGCADLHYKVQVDLNQNFIFKPRFTPLHIIHLLEKTNSKLELVFSNK